MAAAASPPLSVSRWRERWRAGAWPERLGATMRALREHLPADRRDAWWPLPRRIWVRPEGDGWALDIGGEAPLTLAAPADLAALAQRLRSERGRAFELWLEVPAAQVLVRPLWLPAAARAQLSAVLMHDIDRQTPFAADAVVFDAVAGPARADGQMPVRLAVLPVRVLQPWLERLGPLAAQLAGAAPRAEAGINLLPPAQRAPRDTRNRRLGLVLLVAGLVGLGLAGQLTLANREAALQRLEAARDAAAEQAREARRLRNALTQRAEAAGFLAQRRQAQPSVLALLADVTQRLPDSVVLDRFGVEGDRIVLGGVAPSASLALNALQDSPVLASPALVGAVQPDPSSGRDRFTLSATRRGAAP